MEYTLIILLNNGHTAIRKMRYDFSAAHMENALRSFLKRSQLAWSSVNVYHTATGDFVGNVKIERVGIVDSL